MAKENLCEPTLLRFGTWVAAGEGGFETGLLGPVGCDEIKHFLCSGTVGERANSSVEFFLQFRGRDNRNCRTACTAGGTVVDPINLISYGYLHLRIF
jgi:hypothetical protein